MSAYLDAVARAVRELHGCGAEWARTVAVTEVFRGRTIWEGNVEVYRLSGHQRARVAYAWGYAAPGDTQAEGWQIVTVLEIPPVDSPQTAVKVAIAAHGRAADAP